MIFVPAVQPQPARLEFAALTVCHAEMPAEDRPVFEARAIRLFELLDRKGLGKDMGALAVAINFRLEALARLHANSMLRGWSMLDSEPGMNYIHAYLVKAAAEEPL